MPKGRLNCQNSYAERAQAQRTFQDHKSSSLVILDNPSEPLTEGMGSVMHDAYLSLDLHDSGQTLGTLLLGCRGEHFILAAVKVKMIVKMK